MNKILVPVDFSPAAHNAYLYARAMARDIGASIKLLHIYDKNPHNDKLSFVVPKGEDKKEIVRNRLNEFVQLFPDENEETVLTQLKVEVEILEGLIVETIAASSADQEVEMLVLAKTGEVNSLDRLLGGISGKVAQQARCPVILVPKGVQYQAFQQILYASNFESVHPDKLRQLIEFNIFFKTAIHFVHLAEKEDGYEAMEEIIFDQLFSEADPAFAFSMSTIHHSKKGFDSLLEYAEQETVDLIVLVNRQRGVLDNLLRQSMTKEIAIRSKTPIMVYHLNKNV